MLGPIKRIVPVSEVIKTSPPVPAVSLISSAALSLISSALITTSSPLVLAITISSSSSRYPIDPILSLFTVIWLAAKSPSLLRRTNVFGVFC
jgi:hypothetical protein